MTVRLLDVNVLIALALAGARGAFAGTELVFGDGGKGVGNVSVYAGGIRTDCVESDILSGCGDAE